VEVIVPVREKALQLRLYALLETCLSDNRQAWVLQPDGRYVQEQPGDDEEVATHRVLLRDPWGLDRADSRYTTAEVRAVGYVPPPRRAPTGAGNGDGSGAHAGAPPEASGAGRAKGKGKRTTRR
jgi:hypothetical protein